MNNDYYPPNGPQEPYDWHPWIWIGLSWMFFPPLGLILTIDKLRKDKRWRDAQRRIQNYWQTGRYTGAQPHYQQSYQQAQRQQATTQTTKTVVTTTERTQTTTSRNVSVQYGRTNSQQNAAYADPRTSQPVSNTVAQRQRRIAKLSSPKGGRGLITGGGIVAGLFGFCAVMQFLDYASIDVVWALEESYPLLVFTVIGVVMIVAGSKKVKRSRKFRSYFAKIGSRPSVSIQELAQLTGESYHKTVDDLQFLLEKGAFQGNAYLDLGKDLLVLDPVATEQAQERQAAQARQAAQQAAKKADPSEEILLEIRRINDQIPDEHLTEQIDRIQEITRLILQCQKEHPEKAPQLHSFLSYYLPTTLKILNAYAEMEKQSVQGQNIAGTKARIEGMMDKVVMGFENQLDQLFATDYMDISSDITVLEQMLQKDGLTHDFHDVTRPSSGTSGGSAVQYK